MGRKIIYFVRHGETEWNKEGIRQGPTGHLTPRGREQASATAERFPKERGRPQAIISSPYERTKETAEIISARLGMEVEYSDLLRERKNPTEIIGHSGTEREVRNIVDRIDQSFHADTLRYSDEENFVDLKKRASELLKYIKSRPEERIIMVTHGIFLRMIICYMLYGEKLTASEYNKISYFNPINNAGIAIVQYIPRFIRRDKWRLIVWNDTLIEEEKLKN